jgi:tetratricopeptide (TPR) repeat protein
MAENYDKHLEKAREAVKRKNYDFAVALYLEVMMLAPDNEAAAQEMRATQVRQCQEEGRNPAGNITRNAKSIFTKMFSKVKKDVDKEIMSYENTLKKSPYHINTLMKLASACAEAGYKKRAIVNLQTVLEADKENLEANRALGRLFKEAGNLKEAERAFGRVLKANPHDPEATRAIKDIAADSTYKDISSRGDTYRDQLKNPTKANVLETKQRVIRSEDDFNKAFDIALDELNENLKDSKRHRKVGDLYFKHKDYPNALKYYQQAVEVNPQDFYAREKIADVKLAQFDDVIKQTSDAYRTDPSESNLAKLEKAKQGKMDFSITEWKRRVEDHPTDLNMRFELGKLLIKNKQYDEAIMHLQKTVNDPKVAMQAHYYLGLCFVNNNMDELGIQEFQKALAGMGMVMDEQRKEITYNLARTYEKNSKNREAIDEYQKIMAEDYTYKDVKERVNGLKAKLPAGDDFHL